MTSQFSAENCPIMPQVMSEREELRALTKQLASFQVEVTRVVVPREEIDRRESGLRDRISGSEARAMRWAISLGVLNLGGWASLIWMMAQGA
jgi:chloramphenicol 3-O-phosphotransferase